MRIGTAFRWSQSVIPAPAVQRKNPVFQLKFANFKRMTTLGGPPIFAAFEQKKTPGYVNRGRD
jgi:hypothetical protein